MFVACLHQDRTEHGGLIINVRLSCKFSQSVGATAGAPNGSARRKPAITVHSSGLGLQPQVGATHKSVGCVYERELCLMERFVLVPPPLACVVRLE